MATAAAVTESRGELLQWLNDLLQMNVSKIEQVGTGAILCQVFDSIYGDVPLHKVKFNASHEVDYVANFKILQACFDRHGIGKYIPVDRLVKLKFQDNLEFLQWVKLHWNNNYHGGVYDAMGRRGNNTTQQAARPIRPATAVKPVIAAVANPIINRSPRLAPKPTVTSAPSNDLQRQLTEARLTMDELLKERDFYFGKLRDIEIVCQKQQTADSPLWKQITEILYKTEDGFEMPQDNNTPTKAQKI